MENLDNLRNKNSHIKGWGADINLENEPTYPMKKYTGDDHERLAWERPTLQTSDVEVLRSNERPYLPAVYGTPNPPTGLSGMIRRAAFKKSESSYGHWLPLYFADRINVVEGLIDDALQGKFPNVWKEKGMNAEWRLRPQRVIKHVLVGTLLMGAILSVAKLTRKKL